MKTTKLILGLILSFALFNGCTVNELASSNQIEQESTSENYGNNLRGGSIQSGNYIEILVEYAGNVTEQEKMDARNDYGVSIGMIDINVLDNDSETWIVVEDLYASVGPVAGCCPKVVSTEAEVDDIDLWNAANTTNASI